MPLPFLVNQWACSPWETEVDRQVAIDTDTLSTLPLPEPYEVLPQNPDDNIFPVIQTDIGVDNLPEWYRALTADWPDVSPVIPTSEQILSSDTADVLEWSNSIRDPDDPRLSPQCFDYAHRQVSNAGYLVSGPAHKSDATILVLHEYADSTGKRIEVQNAAMIEAVPYIKDSLLSGRPLLIGVLLNGYDKRPNERSSTPFIEPTNHFVVAVGMGTDDEGNYISYFDYHHAFSASDRLYLRENLTMSSRTVSRTQGRYLTEVRKSTPR